MEKRKIDRKTREGIVISPAIPKMPVSERLFVTVGTIKTHVHHIYGKLGVRGRTQAAARARELELI